MPPKKKSLSALVLQKQQDYNSFQLVSDDSSSISCKKYFVMNEIIFGLAGTGNAD
jgi:hypothetical protein